MRLLSVRIENYGSFRGEHEFIFADRGLTLILGKNQDEPRMNSNGAGKSTLFEAVDWCQHGDIPRGDNVDSIINESCDVVQVTNYYDDNGVPTAILRMKKKGKPVVIKYWRNSEPVTALDSKELQRRINLDLGLDREVFHATVLYAQNDEWNFASGTDSERMAILTKILGLKDIDELSDIVSDKLKVIGNDISSAEFQISRQQGKLEVLNPENSPDYFKIQHTTWENSRAQALRDATRQLTEFLSNIKKSEEMVATEDRVRAMNSTFNPMGKTVYDWKSFDAQINEARTVENQWRAALAKTEAEIQAIDTQIVKIAMTPVDVECGECGQNVPKSHLEGRAKVLESQKMEKMRQRQHEQSSLNQAIGFREVKEAEKQRMVELHQAAELDLAKRTKESEILLKQIGEAKEYLEKAKPHVVSIRNKMSEIQSQVNPWVDKELEYQNTLVELKQAEDKRSLAQSTKAYYDYWKKAFGPAGLKNYILDSRLQDINDAANYWVKLMTGGTFWVRIETQTMGRATKKLSNRINIRVFRYNRDGTISDRSFRTWSGGEKKRVAWAINFGLSRLVAARATKQWDVLVLDEVFNHVDAKGGEAIIEVLQHLRKEKSSIFVIEHDSDFKSQFENRVVVQRENGCSRVLEEMNVSSEKPKKEVKKKVNKAPKKKSKKKIRRKGVRTKKAV